eukprot:4820590-Alexandrium_andersonii.AAC.1
MSASLVGSEMCIRDRDDSVASVAGRGPGVGRGRAPPSCRRGARCRGPVSYTHLTLPTICSV